MNRNLEDAIESAIYFEYLRTAKRIQRENMLSYLPKAILGTCYFIVSFYLFFSIYVNNLDKYVLVLVIFLIPTVIVFFLVIRARISKSLDEEKRIMEASNSKPNFREFYGIFKASHGRDVNRLKRLAGQISNIS